MNDRRDDPRNIIITGFMGTGKSTVSRLLAERLGREHVDMDDVIVAEMGMSIPQIFERFGEKRFRDKERELCQRYAEPQRLVVATGGGALIPADNRRVMLERAFVVCLFARPEVIEARLLADGEGRPLAASWRALLQQREAAYNEIPAQIDTSDLTPPQITMEIMTLWHNASP